jgi:hypothetical protein
MAHAVAGGQSQLLLGQVPVGSRVDLDQALHAAAASGLQATLALSGVVGVLAGCAVIVLIRPPASVVAPQPALPAQAEPGRPAEHAVLVGRVRDAAGAPLAGAVLALLDGRGSVVARWATAEDGGFLLPTEPGEYVLAAWATGCRPRALALVVRDRHELDIALPPAAAPVVYPQRGPAAVSPSAGSAGLPSTRS